jgi:hypothetical protein
MMILPRQARDRHRDSYIYIHDCFCRDWTVRGQRAVANLMVGTLDNCLIRLGQRDSAKALREFAVVNGVWAHADRQNDGVLVAFPGMDAKPWCFGKRCSCLWLH